MRHRKIGAALALSTAIGAAAALLVGVFQIPPAVGASVIGIVIGAGVARGVFSQTSGARK
jgi:hypothetical protein